jgi:hypothetical protein
MNEEWHPCSCHSKDEETWCDLNGGEIRAKRAASFMPASLSTAPETQLLIWDGIA